jgi:4-amino-4-deoxy-L-arabinose transferase-like glycosyltransferase
MSRIITTFIAIFLVLSIAAKLYSGRDPGHIQATLWWPSLAIESLCVLALFCRRRRLAAFLLIALAFGGIIVAETSHRPCGCFGRVVELSRQQHILMASSLGLVGCVILFWGSHQPMSRP